MHFGSEMSLFSGLGLIAASVLPALDGIKDEKDIVLLEIGGNDIYDEDCPSKKFREDLEVLLRKVCRPGRSTVSISRTTATRIWRKACGR